MQNTGQRSALPLILATASAVVIVAALGWFLTGDSTNGTAQVPTSSQLATSSAEESAKPAIQEQNPPIDIASELRKARLAANADMLVAPTQRNALHYYGRVLQADPQNAIAERELDEMLARLSLRVSQHLGEREFTEAHALSAPVADLRPGHPLVVLTRNALNDRAAGLISAARRSARAGDDERADAVFTAATNVPGVDPEVIARGRRALAADRRTRTESAEQLAAAEQAASEIEWESKVRGAIKSGRLLPPTEDSAAELLANSNSAAEAKSKLEGELFDALVAAGQESTARGDIVDAEAFVAAASGLRADIASLDELRLDLERKIIAREESKILGMSDFIAVETPPAKYPRTATQLNATGWVDVLFTVTSVGTTADIEIFQAEPAKLFNRSAIEAVKTWTFQPREFRGQPINQRASVRLTYQLE